MASLRIRPDLKPARRKHRRGPGPEQIIQRSCVEYLLTVVLPPPEGPVWTAVNPVPSKSGAVAGISKAMGLVKGFPDLLIWHRSRLVLIEFKSMAGRLEPEQRIIAEHSVAHGAAFHECRSLDQFRDLLRDHGIPTREA